MTRGEMMLRMSATEFMEWRALENIEPYGLVAEYLRNGLLMSMIGNMFKGKDTPAYTALDFMPQFEEPVRKTPEQMNLILTMIQQMQAAQVNG
jgi:hypothetical protein